MSQGTMEHKGYTGSITVDTEEGILHGRIEFINDLVTFEAETVPKLRAAFRKAVDEYVKTCATIGKEPEKPFSGSFNVRIGPELHRQAALAAKRSEIALNEFVRKAVEGELKRGDAPVGSHKHDRTVPGTFLHPINRRSSAGACRRRTI